MVTRAPEGQRTRYLPEHRIPTLPSLADIAARQDEHVPDLQWPNSIATYSRMRDDDQVTALESSFFRPVHAWDWHLDPGSLTPEAARRLSDDLDLPLIGQSEPDEGTRRYQTGWHTILDHAWTACLHGVAICEIVGATNRDPEWEDGWWRLRRLQPIELRDLDPWSWQTEQDGTLRAVTFDPQTGAPRVELPAHRLQRWSWRAIPGSPIGRSMLRALYRAWLIKDELIRVDAVRHNKAAVGTWIGTLRDQDGDSAQRAMESTLAQMAVGEHSFATKWEGQEIDNVGVTGQMTDPIESIRMHDQAMAKAWGVQVIELGSSGSGHRALGETFEAIADSVRESVAAFVAEELTRQTVSRWVEWNNIAPDTAPEIRVRRPSAPALPAAPIIVDTPQDDGQLEPVAAAREQNPDDGSSPVRGVPHAVRPLTDEERASRLDFAAVHASWIALRDWLVEQWRQVREAMIAAGITAVAAIRDLDDRIDQVHDLVRTAAAGAVTAEVLDRVADRLADTAQAAAVQIQTAARAAGLDPDPVDVAYRDRAIREARAVSQTLGYTVADQVGRRAQDMAGPGVSAERVTADIAADLAELTDAHLNDLAGSSATRAQHTGQFAAYEAAEANGEIREIYYSSVLDGRTCQVCAGEDGKTYATLAEAATDFPSSGYLGCEGGPGRCRCMPIIVWDTEQDVAVR